MLNGEAVGLYKYPSIRLVRLRCLWEGLEPILLYSSMNRDANPALNCFWWLLLPPVRPALLGELVSI